MKFAQISPKIYYFCQHSKKAKKWPNCQTILFLANNFKKGHIWQIWPLKRPNGNTGIGSTLIAEKHTIAYKMIPFITALISGVFLGVLVLFDTWGDLGVIIPLFVAGICNCGSDTLLTGYTCFSSQPIFNNVSLDKLLSMI